MNVPTPLIMLVLAGTLLATGTPPHTEDAANRTVHDLVVADNGLLAIGSFTSIGETATSGVAYFDGSRWTAMGSGLPSYGGGTVTHYDGKFYAFGEFSYYRQQGERTPAEERRYRQYPPVRWEAGSSEWTPAFGGGAMSDPVKSTAAQYFFHVQGSSSGFQGAAYNQVTGKNSAWTPLFSSSITHRASGGSTREGYLSAVYTTADGKGVLIGGTFDWIGEQSIGAIAHYNRDTETVSPIGGGLWRTDCTARPGRTPMEAGSVNALVSDGTFHYAAGQFSRDAGGTCLNNIARFDTRTDTWEDVGGGCDGPIYDMLVWDNQLYVTGDFQQCGGTRIANIAVRDLGSQKWQSLGLGVEGTGYALAQWRGTLYVGGTFGVATVD